MRKYLIYCAVMSISLIFSFDAKSGNLKQTTVESLIGKYQGVIRVVRTNSLYHGYQTEILSVDEFDKTVELTAYCLDCESKAWKRTGCRITETKENIRFTCKGRITDEEYTFNGGRLKATGFGNNFPYTIDVSKINE